MIPERAMIQEEVDALPKLQDDLKETCDQFSTLLRPSEVVTKQTALVASQIEASITRLDEFSVFLEAIRSGTTCTLTLLPDFQTHINSVETAFSQIDSLKGYLDALEKSLDQFDQRIELAERIVESKQEPDFISFFNKLVRPKIELKPEDFKWEPVSVPKINSLVP